MKTPCPIRWLSLIRGVVVIAATYIYFLIFAQFAFLHLAQLGGLTVTELQTIMGAMAVSGMVCSLGVARVFREKRARLLLTIGFLGSGMAALLTLIGNGSVFLFVVAALIGACLALLTVCLAASLPLFFDRGHLGLALGLGTGVAYAFCNIPAVFAGTPTQQAVVAIAACGIGMLAILFHRMPVDQCPLEEADDSASISFAPLVIIFLALVWLDSAAFSILQATPALNQFGWGSATLQWSNAGIHFVAAILAGIWLDRRGLLQVLVVAFVFLAAAAMCVSANSAAAGLTHWLYAAGVSLYSTALIFVPAMGVARGDLRSAARRAGVLYSVAGWIGSALGIGMALDRHSIPTWFVGLAGGVVAIHVGWCCAQTQRALVRRSFAAMVVGALVFTASRTSGSFINARTAASDALLGREVYIAEGCIHCHSQYVRPSSVDVEWWGPAATLERVLREEPPLIGNRRQGPDLLNVGNRRSREWNRLHLLDPRMLVPASRMPSYAHLFKPGDPRGEALLTYLAELGADTFEARGEIRRNWSPRSNTPPITDEKAAVLFRTNCTACHGEHGAGNGPLANSLGPRLPRDLTLAQWQFIPPREAHDERLLELARVIKFGVPTTSMPGHETLTDAELIGLARHIESLRVLSHNP